MTGSGATDINAALADFAALEHRLEAQTKEIAALIRDSDQAQLDRHVPALWRTMKAQVVDYRSALTQLANPAAGRNLPPDKAAILRGIQRQSPQRLSLWPRFDDAIARLAAQGPAPLVTEKSEQVLGRESGAVNNLMRILSEVANPDPKASGTLTDDSYSDIRLSGAYFLNLCAACYRILCAEGRRRPIRFLDVGCGGGTKVLTAGSFFEFADGLELDPAFARNARDWLARVGNDGLTIIDGDALTFDRYGDYDVIYFYRPFRDTGLQARLEERVCAQARPGSLIIAPLTAALHQMQPPDVVRLDNAIFRTGTTTQEAAALVQKARFVGPDVVIENRVDDAVTGFWHPLLLALRDRGISPR